MALTVANVELSDSFNTWRLRTNSIIAEAIQSNSSVTFTQNQTFSANVNINGGLTVGSTSSTFNSNTVFNANTVFNDGINTNYLNVTGQMFGTLTTGNQPNITEVGILSSLEMSGAVTGVTSLTASGTINCANVIASGTVTGAELNSTSDVRLKENIVNIKNALDTVQQLEGKTFSWKESGKPSIGFIAQEVEKILPEVINTMDDGFKTINYNVIVALLVEAIKEQQEQIEQLKQS
jgi:hypothetical protein